MKKKEFTPSKVPFVNADWRQKYQWANEGVENNTG